ncbi:class I SAM-dependent methyltransferase [Catellatospora sichuanensis]|uniref:class I SAM-dependent methyltransferase n=1 Tax=Catellatospora sichuanensis TaxID=1969805 RepID=UPI0011839019|nr:class I SAM-dependent methyltransferase [Catellatospora sichuanensis]
MGQEYAVTAEFYDLLQATEHLAVTGRLLDRWLGRPEVGVLDVGAGTGLATNLLARRCAVTVHAVEPAASMRAVLLSRLAGHTEVLPRVRLYARNVQDLGLAGIADFAWCLNTMAGLDLSDRAAALRALATALVPGGRLVVQRPPTRAAEDRRDLPSWQLGGDLYSGEVTTSPVGADRVRWRFSYRVSRDGALVREESEVFDGHLATESGFDAELVAAGFTVIGTDDPDIVVARR